MASIQKYIDNEEMGIKSTNKIPFVWFAQDGALTIKGRSIPENGTEFYENLFDWVREYIMNPWPSTTISIELEYLNDITSKYLLQIIKELNYSCPRFSVEWTYEEGHDDILEQGKILESASNAHFTFTLLNINSGRNRSTKN